ncbi:MAG: Fic family protein [Bacteroidetes bacterium]|nr:Fic family protein [Bacteroidota bacterium]
MRPPYQITNKIIELVASISEKIGEVNSAHLYKPSTELRKKNRIKTIQSSLEIEGNSLSFEQITAILENKKVIAPQKDILEVKNAILVYDRLNEFNPNSLTSFCKAHGILMKGLIDNAGKIRSKSVGIIKGSVVTHVAPPGNMVRSLLKDLFVYLKKDKDLLLIKSCVFHYETEFIHPFMDGNGRMGRLWQTVILRQYSPVFEFLPVESLIKTKQLEYYNILGESDNQGNSTGFVEFMLQIINDSLEDLLTNQNVNLTSDNRINLFKEKSGSGSFTRQDYMRQFKDISSATASRDLKEAVENGILEKTGDKRTTSYKFRK